MIKIKKLLILFLILVNGLLAAQNNEELAKSYFLQAQEAYGNENTESAISSLDNCVKMLGETNAKIEALYIEIKRANLGPYYDLEVKQHLDNYLKIASADRPEYEEILKSVPYIKRSAESYKKKLAEALKDNANRNWEETGPLCIKFMGCFNSNGKLAFESNFGGDEEQFRDGFALIKEYESNDWDYKMYLIDKKGEKFSETNYDDIYEKGDGAFLTELTANDGNSYQGLINTETNKELKVPNFVSDWIGPFQDNGVAVFRNNKNLHGLLNKEGEILVKPIYNRISPFKNGLAYASGLIERNGEQLSVGLLIRADGTINFEGKPGWIIGGYNDDGLVSFKNTLVNDKYGYFSDGQVVIEPEYDYAGEFSEGLAIVRNGNSYIIIDKQNKKLGIINEEFIYDYSNSLFNNGVVILQNKVKDGYYIIGKTGETIKEIKCTLLRSISENTLLFRKKNYFLINLDSNLTKDLETSNNINISTIYQFNEGLAKFSVLKDKEKSSSEYLYGYMNNKGTIVIPPIYYEGELFRNGEAIVYDKYFNKTAISPSDK